MMLQRTTNEQERITIDCAGELSTKFQSSRQANERTDIRTKRDTPPRAFRLGGTNRKAVCLGRRETRDQFRITAVEAVHRYSR